MTEKDTHTPSNTSTPAEAPPSSTSISPIWIVLGVVFFLVLIAGVVLAVTVMVKNPGQTETIRDIMIIFMAFVALIIGFALVILLVQLARLTNLLRYEIGPILEATNETIGSLRGTTRFLSDNLVTPVVKANSTFAALRRAIELVDFRRSK